MRTSGVPVLTIITIPGPGLFLSAEGACRIAEGRLRKKHSFGDFGHVAVHGLHCTKFIGTDKTDLTGSECPSGAGYAGRPF
jgi:hypothetical protein